MSDIDFEVYTSFGSTHCIYSISHDAASRVLLLSQSIAH